MNDLIESALGECGSYVPADVVANLVAAGVSVEELMLRLVPRAKKFAIPPISSFFVGAVAQGNSGALYLGANYEFEGAALSFCVHAEQAATAHALSYGETGLRRIAVSAAPCGYCRQFLYELTTGETLEVLAGNAAPTLLTALLPAAFGPKELGVEAGLMSPQSHGLRVDSPDRLTDAALAACNVSYAPYSKSYAGVALQTGDGEIYTGSVAENAAYNPSFSPLQAAIVGLIIRGGKSYVDLVDAALVEVEGAVASQVDASVAVLSSIADFPLRIATAG